MAETGAQSEAPATGGGHSWRLIARLYNDALRHHLGLLILSFSCMAAIAAMASAYTYLMGPLVDKVFIARNASLLWLIGGSVIGIFVVRSAASYTQEVLLVSLGQKIVLETQKRLFGSIVHQDMALFDQRPSGTLVGTFTYDVNLLRATICEFFLRIGKDTLTVVSMLGLMFYTDWRMALASTVALPLALFPILYLSRKLRRLSLETQAGIGRLTATLTQAFQAIRFVKTYRLESLERTRVKDQVQSLARLLVRTTQVEAAILPVFDGLGGLALAGIIVYGGAHVVGQAMTPGAFVIFAGAVYNAYQPMRSLARVNVDLQTGLAAAQRVFDLIDRKASVVDAAAATVLPRVAGDIAFEAVDFSYGGRETALKATNFVAPAGAVTALVGRTGAGKSTIFNLISRFYDPARGRIVINGSDIRDVTATSLRDSIAVVSQDVILFEDTIANNIRFGRKGASDTDVLRAAHAVGALDFILRFPDGLETRIGEDGVRLSAGQRQRIAIARAILRDAPILLLDEMTSAQDAESEQQIQGAVAQLMQGRTTIVITHRMSTIRNADVIHVVERGTVLESGPHEALMAREGIYAQLFSTEHASLDLMSHDGV